jgi:hypothetical protein
MKNIDTFSIRNYEEEIRNILFDDRRDMLIEKVDGFKKDFHPSKEYILENYKEAFLTFPTYTSSAKNEIKVWKRLVEIIHYYDEYIHTDVEDEIALSALNKTKGVIDSEFDGCPKWIIADSLEVFFQNLNYRVAEMLNNSKDIPIFQGIEDEEIIINNLLNHYSFILSSKSHQLDVLSSLQLSKEISDIIVRALISVLEFRMMIRHPSKDYQSNKQKKLISPPNEEKIEWLGNQQELCELILSLSEKGWIENIERGNISKTANRFGALFDFSKTKKSSKSNEIISLYQILKGEVDPDNKTKKLYFYDRNINYQKKFDKISIRNEQVQISPSSANE